MDSSRRELFKSVIPKAEGHDGEREKDEDDKTASAVLSRRDAMKFLTGLSMLFASERGLGASKNASDEKQSEDLGQLSKRDLPLKLSIGDVQSEVGNLHNSLKEKPYLNTAIESGLLTASKYIGNKILKRLGIPVGTWNSKYNKGTQEKSLSIREKIEAGLIIGGIKPLTEEIMFRLLPSKFLAGKSKEIRWDIGIPTAAIFALRHTYGEDALGKLQFVKTIPLSQFVGGLFYWYLMRQRGFSHAWLGHSVNNSSLVIAKYLFDNIKEK